MLKPTLILLDRDGVINQDLPRGVSSREAFQMIPGSLEAIATFKKNGLKVAVVSNQALVGRGELSREDLESIHQDLQDKLMPLGGCIDHFFVCTDTSPSLRRKPAPGMLLEAMTHFKTHPLETVMVGDDVRDFEAAEQAGCSFIQVRTGKGENLLRQGFLNPPPHDFLFLKPSDFDTFNPLEDPCGTRFLAIADHLYETIPWLTHSSS